MQRKNVCICNNNRMLVWEQLLSLDGSLHLHLKYSLAKDLFAEMFEDIKQRISVLKKIHVKKNFVSKDISLQCVPHFNSGMVWPQVSTRSALQESVLKGTHSTRLTWSEVLSSGPPCNRMDADVVNWLLTLGALVGVRAEQLYFYSPDHLHVGVI